MSCLPRLLVLAVLLAALPALQAAPGDPGEPGGDPGETGTTTTTTDTNTDTDSGTTDTGGAKLEQVTVEVLPAAKIARVVLHLGVALDQCTAHPEGKASYLVRLPGIQRGDDVPEVSRSANWKGTAIAEVRAEPDGGDLLVTVRLNTPVHCESRAKPDLKQVWIDCDLPGPQVKPTGPAADPLINADFADVDIAVILEELVAQTGRNLVVQPSVTGTYSASLHNLPLSQALDAITDAWNLTWTELPGGVLLIGKDDDLGERQGEAKLPLPKGWSLADGWAVLVDRFPDLRLLRPLAAQPAAGPLEVAGSLRDIGHARRWLAGLVRAAGTGKVALPPPLSPDRTRQPLVYRVRYARAGELSKLVRQTVPELTVVEPKPTASQGLGPATPSPTLVLLGPAAALDRALKLLEAVDVAPAEVELQAVLADVGPKAADQLGLGKTGPLGSVVRPGMDLAAAVALLERDNQSTLVARPTLRTTDGEPARFLIGDRLAKGRHGVRAGAGLEVTPTVAGDGTVVCRIHPQLAELTQPKPGVVDTREAELTARVPDGGTVVVTGLLGPDDDDPRTELVLLLTVRVVKPTGAPPAPPAELVPAG